MTGTASTPSTTILIVEDEPKLSSLLSDYMQQAGYAAVTLANGNEVLPWLKQQQPDLILLDVMLPGTDGLTLCREIRKSSNIPIIMITARVEEIDRLLGLELGADDYICKPFSPREVVARAKAIFRRTRRPVASLPITIDDQRMRATVNAQELQLTAIEFALLKTLLKEPGRIFSRDQLMNLIYNDRRIVTDRTVDSHIKKLRKKMNLASPEQDFIQSVYGVGYKIET